MQTIVWNTEATRQVSDAFSNEYIKGTCYPERVMSEHVLVYMLDGEWEILLNGVPYTLESDDVMLLAAGVVHGGVLPCKEGTKTMFLHVSAAKGDLFHDEEETRIEENGLVLPPLVHCRDYPQLKKGFEELVGLMVSELPCKGMRMDALFKLLFADLYDAANERSNTERNEFVEAILHMLHDSPHLFYTNEELSERFGVCPKTLVTRFRRQTGCTPYQYQMKYKLRCIESLLLKQPNVKQHDLAINFGFYDEFHLSRAFKNAYGMSPSDYKRVHTDRQLFISM